eukprot:2746342-Karenia_brevis.AAC.1
MSLQELLAAALVRKNVDGTTCLDAWRGDMPLSAQQFVFKGLKETAPFEWCPAFEQQSPGQVARPRGILQSWD